MLDLKSVERVKLYPCCILRPQLRSVGEIHHALSLDVPSGVGLREERKTTHWTKADPASIKIYIDGSSIDGGIGAAAVLYTNNTLRELLQHHLGSDRHHTVYEAEL